jgi:putative transposase
MIFQFIHQHRSHFSVERVCNVLNVSVSGYYAFRKRKRSKREIDNERLLVDIRVASILTGNVMEALELPSGLEKKKGGPVVRTELLAS